MTGYFDKTFRLVHNKQ